MSSALDIFFMFSSSSEVAFAAGQAECNHTRVNVYSHPSSCSGGHYI